MKNNVVNRVKQPEGNYFDKYNSSNIIIKSMMKSFFKSFEYMFNCIEKNNVENVLEAGCGEGEITNFTYNYFCGGENIKIDAFDISENVIKEAQEHYSCESIVFTTGNIYNISCEKKYDLVICSEVLEHLEEPEKALKELGKATKEYIICSVPREPIWCFLNMCRGKYIKQLGNTPGHIQHWSKRAFLKFLRQNGFKIVQVKSPLPWTVVLISKKS